MGIIRKRIQEQVGQSHAIKMLVERRARREDKPRPVDPARFRFPGEIAPGLFVVDPKPKHAISNRTENLHPNVKDAWGYFVALVETAKHKSVFRQTLALPRCSHQQRM
ncbi:hypothetical protein D9M73_97490 [compost metagenome]